MSDPVTRLNAALEGRYHIERELGEGGMATVYLAEDLKHERKVAVKVLRPELAAVIGAERFLAEIKTTANLTHPHILPLHDSGEADSFLFYVMPFVEGETLRDRINREKQLPVDEAVRIATAVANALDHAHRHGVIHRDIKPANILLQDGEPVVADFGIALAVGAAGSNRLTETGLSLGTPYYMSPEQATGDQNVGASTDTYALGCVLYEMLVGDPPYAGSTAQAVLGKIIAGKRVSATEERPSVPANVDAAVRKALEKLPADRFTSAQDFARALGDEHFRYGETAAAVPGADVGPWTPLALAATAVAVFFAGVAAWGWLQPEPPPPFDGVPTRSDLTGLTMNVTGGLGRRLAVSPDGKFFVAGGRSASGEIMLHVRPAGALEWRELRGTEDGDEPSFSPDGDWVAFMNSEGLWKVQISGGLPIRIGPSRSGGMSLHWGANDTIVYTIGGRSPGLYAVPGSGGGSAELLFEPTEYRAIFPHMLPDGSGVLFATATVGRDPLTSRIMLYDTQTEEVTDLNLSGNNPIYVPTGHIVYGHGDQSLKGVSFDLKTREVGSPSRLIEELTVFGNGAAQYDVSQTGTLIYNADLGNEIRSFVEVELDGTRSPLNLAAGNLYSPRYSPDGRTIAYVDDRTQSASGIRLYDVITGANPQFTDGGGFSPVWSPEGEYLYFAANRPETTLSQDGFRRRVDMSQPAEQLFKREGVNYARAVSAGDSIVLVQTVTSLTGNDFVLMRMGPDGSVPDSAPFEPYLTAGWNEQKAEISPNGRYVAYTSNEEVQGSARKVYVRTFPVPTGRIDVSPGLGDDPQWSPDGETLYYVGESDSGITTFYAVDVTTDSVFTVGQPRELFPYPAYYRGQGEPQYDVHPDGDRFILTETNLPNRGLQDVYIVTNWFTELKGLMGN